MHRDVEGTADVVAASYVKGQVVKEIFKGVAEVVGRAFGHQLLPKLALHIKGIGDTVTGDMDVELHLLALCGLDVVLLNFHLIGEGLLEMLLIIDDALRGLHGKRRQKHHQCY